MPSRKLDFPVFDADNHMYETTEAFTKYLPTEYEGLIKYVAGERSHQDRRQQQDQRLHPQPDLRGRGRARGPGGVLQGGNPEGKSRREILGKGIRALPGFSEPEPRLELMDELGIDRAAHVAHPGQPARGAAARQPARRPRRRARPQPVDARALDVQLREPHVPDPGHPPGHRRRGHRGARLGARAGGPDHPDPARAGLGLHGPALAGPARVRPVLGQGGRGRPPGGHARLGQRLPALHQRVGGRHATAR